MRRIDWKRVFQSGVMQLFGATYIMWIERLMAGISHQHVLSYNPVFVYTMCKMQIYVCIRICIWKKYITWLLSKMVHKLSRSSLLDYYDTAGVRNSLI